MPTPNLYELVEGTGPIYVKNDTARYGMPMTLMIDFKDKHGRSHPVMLPSMKWPVDISMLVAPRNLLVESTDFLRLCQTKRVKVMDASEAERMLSQPGAREAVQRAFSKSKGGQAQMGAIQAYNLRVKGNTAYDASLPETQGVGFGGPNDVEARLTEKFTAAMHDPNAPNVLDDLEFSQEPLQANETVNPRVAQWMATLNEDADSREEVFADLQSQDDEFYSDEDLGFIIEQAHGHPTIASWARKLLAKRQPVDEPGRKRRKKRRG